MTLYVDSLDKYADFMVGIYPGRGSGIETLSGVSIAPEVSLGSEAQMDAAIGSQAMGIAKGFLTGIAGKVSGIAAEAVRKNFNSLNQSAISWQAGSPMTVSVSFTVFKRGALAAGTVESYNQLAKITSKMTQTKSDASNPIQEPSYYDLLAYNKAIASNDASSLESQLYTVTIGDWFRCPILMPTSQNITYSSYVDLEGAPVFATVSCSFITYRALTADEFAGVILR